jgi:predicted RND superfamily exporter protein
MSRRPLLVAIVALVVGALGAAGLARFSVDAGQSLLVGSGSSAAQTYATFSKAFGSDPVVIVLTARNPLAPYLEPNLQRLGAFEIDLAHDPRVASVLGPGTVAGSLRQAAVSEVAKVLTEYPYFVAETDYISQIEKGNNNQTQLSQQLQSDISNSQALLEYYVLKAASDAHNARAQYKQKSGDRVLDSREKAVDAAVAADPLPPLWAQYLSGPGSTADETAARQFFDRVTAAFGDCDDQLASVLKITPSCQVFFERTLLDLPHCPPVNSQLFCSPKPQWNAVLPTPGEGADSHVIITIRVKPQYIGDQTQITSLVDKINTMFAHGITRDSYTSSLSAASFQNLKKLGPLRPSECGGQSDSQSAACNKAYHDARLAYTTAGAPLLGHGVVNAMTTLLIILFPVALFVMALLLVGTFRVRGRIAPLLAALAATVLTVGLSLLTGTPITPAVLAGVPVLIGLGVDYAVQLVARFAEERSRGADAATAVDTVLAHTGRATLVAAIATLVGLVALFLVSQFDWGPLVAVPLVAEFALVLCVGVVLAWLGGLFIALPLAIWMDRRSGLPAAVAPTAPARPERTLAIADNWMGIAVPAAVLALAGWALLRIVPVQTDVQQLLAPSLPELAAINAVQAETGYTNEIDVFVRGQVAGPYNRASIPASVVWQCQAAVDVRNSHPGVVATATSIADFFIASGSDTSATNAQACAPPATGPSPSPSPSPSASPSPGSTPGASPTSQRPQAPDAVLAARHIDRDAASTPTPLPLTSPPASPAPASPGASTSPSSRASPSPSASPAPSSTPKTQTLFLCQMRLFPLLSRTLVMPIGPDAQPCPAIDEYQSRFLTTDSNPIDPTAARIALGVHTNSVAQQAQLVDSLARDLSKPPNGLSAAPTGLAVLATTAYENLVGRAYLLNLAPLALVAIVLLLIYREPRRALLPLVPTALAAGWAPLILLLLGRLPGGVGATLGSLNPLTVVLGALVIALGTEFGVVLLGRFYEERERGLDPDAAAAAALGGVGRAIRVSALTLGAGFGVLAISGFVPNSLPLISDFGLAVVVDLALAVLAVFGVMLPLAVAIERRAVYGVAGAPATAPITPAAPPDRPRPRPDRRPAPASAVPPTALAGAGVEAPPQTAAPPRRQPGVSGRRRRPTPEALPGAEPLAAAEQQPRRKPGVSGRRKRAAAADGGGAVAVPQLLDDPGRVEQAERDEGHQKSSGDGGVGQQGQRKGVQRRNVVDRANRQDDEGEEPGQHRKRQPAKR